MKTPFKMKYNTSPLKSKLNSPFQQGEGFGHLQDGAMRAQYGGGGGTSVSFRWPWESKKTGLSKMLKTASKTITSKSSSTEIKPADAINIGETVSQNVSYVTDTIGDAAAGIVSYYEAFKDTLSKGQSRGE